MSSSTERLPAGPEQGQRSIRVPQLVLSLLTVAVFALLAVWWQTTTSERVPVVALANDVVAGSPITRADLTEIRINADISPEVAPAEFIDVFVGTVPIGDFAAGTLITDRMFRTTTALGPGQAFVGVRVDSTRAPSGLAVGDRVQALLSGPDDAPVVLAPDAEVESVSQDGDRTSVRLRMGIVEAQLVQIQADSVVLIEIPNTGPASWDGGEDS